MLDRRILWTWARLVILGFVIAVVAGMFWVPRLVDTRAVIGVAVQEVEASTGRTLAIKGPVEVHLWPRLSVVADDVAFGNASWAADPEMATARRIALSLDWIPLLQKKVSISRAELDGLVLSLQPGGSDAASGNWDLTGSDTDTADDSAFHLRKIQINDATLRLRDQSGQLLDTLIVDKLGAVFKESAIKFNGHVVWRKQAGDLQGKFEYADNGPPSLAMSVNARSLDLAQLSDGRADHRQPVKTQSRTSTQPWWQDDRPIGFSSLPRINLELDFNAERLLLSNGMVLPNTRLIARLDEAESGTLTLERFSSDLGKGRVSIAGDIKDLFNKAPVVSLQANAEGFDLAQVFSMQAIKQPRVNAQGGAVKVGVQLSSRGSTPRQLMNSLGGHGRASIGPGSLVDHGDDDHAPKVVTLKSFNGRADLTPGNAPVFALDLEATKIDLHDQRPASREPAAHEAVPPEDKARRWLFSNAPLGLNQLPLMNGSIGLKVGQLVLPDGIVLPDVLFNANVRDSDGGVMKIEQLKTGFGGGALAMDGEMSHYTTSNPALRLRGHATNFRLDQLLTQMDQTRQLGAVKGGQGELAFHLEGQGGSLRALASGLNGELQLSLSDVTMPRAIIDSTGDFLLSVLNAVNPLRAKSDTTQLRCLAAYVPIHDGRVKIDNTIGLATDQTDVLLHGKVNLQDESLHISIESSQKTGLTTGVNPAGLVVIDGTLMHPTLGVNKTGVVKQAASVGLAVVTSGLSLAAQNLLSVTTKKDPCQNILRPWPGMDAQLVSDGEKH